jgi:Tfp pilus assembly protein PilN
MADLMTLRRAGLAPQVNLLPKIVLERRALKRQRSWIAGAVALVLVVLLAAWYIEGQRAGNAEDRAERAEAAAAQAETEKASLQRFADLRDSVNELTELRATVYRNELRSSSVLQDFTQLVPERVALDQLALRVTAETTGAVAGGGTTDPAATAAPDQAAAAVPGAPGYNSPVATISLTGKAASLPDVATFMRSLNGKVKRDGREIYVNPYYTSAVNDTGSVSFTATVDLTSAAFSGRFQESVASTTEGG